MQEADNVPHEKNVSAYAHNPSGRNQYTLCPAWDDPRLQGLILKYDREGIIHPDQLSRLLRNCHNIQISATSVKRCRKKMGLKGSGATTREMGDTDKRQLVLDQMAKDPTRRRGPRLIKEDIARETGIHLTRDYIEMEMRLQDPDGFLIRDPHSKKLNQSTLVLPGPHCEWRCTWHDKLSDIGAPIWGIRDMWSGKCLGLWVVPPNEPKVTVAYLYLSVVEELGGMPIQTTSCGSKNSQGYAFASALHEMFSPDLPISVSELQEHQFLKSIHDTTIKPGSLRLCLNWGDNIEALWERGQYIYGYDSNDPKQHNLVQWLWPKLIQQELDTLKYHFNTHRARKDKKKKTPSGVSPDIAMALPEKYDGVDCLQAVNVEPIQTLMAGLGGKNLLQFVSHEYAEQAQAVFDSLNTKLTVETMWHVFRAMIPLINE